MFPISGTANWLVYFLQTTAGCFYEILKSDRHPLPMGRSRKAMLGEVMTDTADIKAKIFSATAALLEVDAPVSEEHRCIGDDSALDSQKLLELCLSLEDIATDLGFEFDWTSEMAMSKSRSMFRTAGALAEEFLSQMAGKK